jgi:hypothetical protein
VAIGRDTGSVDTGPEGVSLVERWDGRAWSYLREHGLPGRAGELLAVSCAPASGFCVLAGATTDGAGHRNGPGLWTGQGDSWTRADLRTETGAVTGVACASPTSCVAVGPGLALRWDGRAWTSIRAADWVAGIRSVSCWAPDRCVSAVTQLPDQALRSQLDRWDGTRWTTEWQSYGGTWDAPGPAPDADVSLLDVSCAGDQRCAAVGFDATDPPGHPVALRRSAAGWGREIVPATWTRLTSVSCVPDGSCVALQQVPPVVAGPPPVNITTSRQGGPWSTGLATPDLLLAALSCQPGTCMAVGGHVGVVTPAPEPAQPTAARMYW